MSRLTRTLSATSLAAVVSAALVAAPSSALAGPALDRIDLETGSQPEGIAAGPGTTFFAGARSDGAVYVGDVRTGDVELLVAGDGEGPAVGMLYDARSGLLWVAGGTGGDITAYDAQTGDEVFSAQVEGAGFLNDVAITRDAVYVTDSFGDALTVVALDRNGQPTGEVSPLELLGYEAPAGFGLNGIRELPGGDLVVVSGGVLYRVDPASGATRVIDVDVDLRGGDGLELRGNQLYVVNGYGGDEVVVLRLQGDSARTTGVLTDEDLDRPTTGALIGGSLYVVNGRFSVAGDPTTEYYVTRLPRR
jgi:streptogramin lyase